MSKSKASDARMALDSRISRGKALTVRGSVAHTSMAGPPESRPAAECGVPDGGGCAGLDAGGGRTTGRAAGRPPIELGNTRCPVRGAPIDRRSFGEWNGLRVGFCSPGCAGLFATVRAKAPSAPRTRKWRLIREPADPGTAR